MRNCGTLSTETDLNCMASQRFSGSWIIGIGLLERHRDTHRHQYQNINKDSRLIFIMDILSTSEYW